MDTLGAAGDRWLLKFKAAQIGPAFFAFVGCQFSVLVFCVAYILIEPLAHPSTKVIHSARFFIMLISHADDLLPSHIFC